MGKLVAAFDNREVANEYCAKLNEAKAGEFWVEINSGFNQTYKYVIKRFPKRDFRYKEITGVGIFNG